MVSVCEKADGLARVSELEEAKGTLWALGDLAQSHEHADHSNGQDKDAHKPPFAVIQQEGAQKDRKRRQQRKGTEPCCAWHDADGEPGKVALEKIEGRN
jgi:hypothetical protein